MKILLEREDVNPDRLDNRGRTPLWLAAKNGREGVVKLLLEREDVSPTGQSIMAKRFSRGPPNAVVRE